jgi:hypothetical protein
LPRDVFFFFGFGLAEGLAAPAIFFAPFFGAIGILLPAACSVASPPKLADK